MKTFTKIILVTFLTICISSCDNKTSDKPDYNKAFTLRDSLITKLKFDLKSDSITLTSYDMTPNPDEDGVTRQFKTVSYSESIENYADTIIQYETYKSIRFHLSEYTDTLMAHVDYFFSDTLDMPYFEFEIFNENYILEIWGYVISGFRLTVCSLIAYKS